MGRVEGEPLALADHTNANRLVRQVGQKIVVGEGIGDLGLIELPVLEMPAPKFFVLGVIREGRNTGKWSRHRLAFLTIALIRRIHGQLEHTIMLQATGKVAADQGVVGVVTGRCKHDIDAVELQG